MASNNKNDINSENKDDIEPEGGGGRHDDLSSQGSQGSQDDPGGFKNLKIPDKRDAWIRNMSNLAIKFFDLARINYGVSKSQALDIALIHFLKTAEFEGKDRIQIVIPEEQSLSKAGKIPKIASAKLDNRLESIQKIIKTGTYYTIINNSPAIVKIGYSDILNIHDELRRKLMDRTLPDEQRMQIFIALEQVQDCLKNRVEYDPDRLKKECDKLEEKHSKPKNPQNIQTIQPSEFDTTFEVVNPKKEVRDPIFDELMKEAEDLEKKTKVGEKDGQKREGKNPGSAKGREEKEPDRGNQAKRVLPGDG